VEETSEEVEEWLDEILGCMVWNEKDLVQISMRTANMHLGLMTNAISLKIPFDNNSRRRKNELSIIRTFLKNLILPLTLPNIDCSQLIKQAHHFFIQRQHLWWKDHSGHHQLVVLEPNHLCILHKGHNKLGHKGLYST
jgi:hypothetical protein